MGRHLSSWIRLNIVKIVYQFPNPGLEILANREEASTRRHNNDAIEQEVQTATQLVLAFYASESTGKKERTCMVWVKDPNYQGEIGAAPQWQSGTQEILCSILVSPCSVTKINGKLQQPNAGRTANGHNPSGMKV